LRRRLRALTNARIFAARSLLALGLALATLSGASPSGGARAACPMPCCRAQERTDCPSCHHKRPKRSAARASVAHDLVCGAQLKLGQSARPVLPTHDITRRDASADADSIYAPCDSDCSGLLTSLTQRGRDEAVASQGIRPPPSVADARASRPRRADANASELYACRSPRAPPSTLHAS